MTLLSDPHAIDLRHPGKGHVDQDHAGGRGGGVVPIGRDARPDDVEWSSDGRTAVLKVAMAGGGVGTVKLQHDYDGMAFEDVYETETWTDRKAMFQTMDGAARGMRHLPANSELDTVIVKVEDQMHAEYLRTGRNLMGRVHARSQTPRQGEMEVNPRLLSGSAQGMPKGGMPEASALTRNAQVAAHEMGHIVAFNANFADRSTYAQSMHATHAFGLRDSRAGLLIGDATPTKRRVYGLSDYGRTNPHEAYAETFLEWVASNGATKNEPTLIMQEVAGWT